MELDSEVEFIPKGGKEREKFTQGSALSQRQVPEMPMISEPELELSMSNSNRYKSHSEGSDRHLHEPVQAVLHSVEGQGLGNVSTNTPRRDEFLAHPQKIKEYHAKKREATKEEAPVASTSKSQANPLPQEGKKNKKNNWRKPSFPSHRIPKIQKICHGQFLLHGQNLDGIQGQGGEKNETTSFPKEITLSQDVVNTLTEIQNGILPPKEIKNSLLYLKEINDSLSSLTKIVVQIKKIY
ncbi:hypothetical protein O181_062934 [Austropuccinia psidii MF-1]|uniref:Uncharacterized protein n=1 Tax=Austropuccinia psidii MF-1 TaxID=1389203 RepID=A0A9Q3ELD7_9BASI|nr:hypothetical protein [Austropuccinia psidii MF-1]